MFGFWGVFFVVVGWLVGWLVRGGYGLSYFYFYPLFPETPEIPEERSEKIE